MLLQTIHDTLLANETLLWWLAGSSLITFIGSIVLVPVLLARIPADYFSHTKRHKPPWAEHHPLVRGLLIIGKNLLGLIFLVAGIVMLLLPGQGLLTMVMAIVLLDMPGKYRLERWLISRRPVLQAINWLRVRAGRPQLIIDRPR